VYYPQPTASLSASQAQTLLQQVLANVSKIITTNTTASNCTVCKNALLAAKPAALAVPSLVPDAMVELCQTFKFHSNSTCEEDFAATNFGAIWTQILAFGDLGGLDGQYICNSLSSTFCPRPKTWPQLDTTKLFPKAKPKNPCVPKKSGKRVKVLHRKCVLSLGS
jgi:hypothetical protein